LGLLLGGTLKADRLPTSSQYFVAI